MLKQHITIKRVFFVFCLTALLALSTILFSRCSAAGAGAAGDAAAKVPNTEWGALNIVGDPVVGLILAVDINKVKDRIDSLNYTYRWQRHSPGGAVLKIGDNSNVYRLKSEDAGARIQVSLDIENQTSGPVSQQTDPVRWPVINGTLNIDSGGNALVPNTILNAVTVNLSGAGSPVYTWSSGNNVLGFAPLTGAIKKSYTLTKADVGKIIRVRVSMSETTGYLNAELNSEVRELDTQGNVDIIGTPEVFQTLTAVTSFGESEISGYTWYANGISISGAVSKTYALTNKEFDKIIKVEVNRSGRGVLVSRETARIINPQLSGTVTIIPAIASVGTTLFVDLSGVIGANGNIAYQWAAENAVLRGMPVNGPTYTPVQADIDKRIKVKITYDQNRNVLESSLTSEIARPLIQGSVLIKSLTKTSLTAVLSADYNDIEENSTFTWWRNGVKVKTGKGISYKTFTVSQEDAGKTIKLAVSSMNLIGSIYSEITIP